MTRLTPAPLALSAPSQALQVGGARWRDAATRLAERFDVAARPVRSVQRLLLDDRKWRLARAGYTLEAIADAGTSGPWLLRLRRLGSAQAARRKAPPVGSWLEVSVAGLPLGPIRPAAAPPDDAGPAPPTAPQTVSVLPPALARALPAAVRSLKVKVSATLRLREVALRDGLVKTVVHLDWWEAPAPARGAWIEARPVRGYDAEHRRLVAALGWTPALAAPGVDAFYRLASLLPAAAGLPMPAGASAAYCVAVLVRRELDAMQAALPGVFAGEGPQSLHLFRVASRRLRSLLRVAKGVAPRAAANRVVVFLRWLNGISGPVRDRHLLLADWDALVAGMAPRETAGAARLKARIEAECAALGGDLGSALTGERYTRGMAQVAALCADTVRWGTQRALDDADALASRRIVRSFERFVAEGQRISEASPAEALHDLRKTGKQLRYVLELLGPLASGDARRARPLVKRLKKLQDVLGTFQDQAARAELLERTARQDKQADEDATLGALHDAFDATAATARDAFAAAFAEFCSKECHADIAALTQASPLTNSEGC